MPVEEPATVVMSAATGVAAAAIATTLVMVAEETVPMMAAAIVAVAATTARSLAGNGNLLTHDHFALDYFGDALIFRNRAFFFLPHLHANGGRVLANLF